MLLTELLFYVLQHGRAAVTPQAGATEAMLGGGFCRDPLVREARWDDRIAPIPTAEPPTRFKTGKYRLTPIFDCVRLFLGGEGFMSNPEVHRPALLTSVENVKPGPHACLRASHDENGTRDWCA